MNRSPALAILSAAALLIPGAMPAFAAPSGATAVAVSLASGMQSGRTSRAGRDRNYSPAEIRAEAEAAVAGSGLPCTMSGVRLAGQTSTRQRVYEVSCATTPGFLVVVSEPVTTFNCIQLAANAEAMRRQDPEADVGLQCVVPANLDIIPVVRSIAQQAGVGCTVDEGRLIGLIETRPVYEVGCQGADGFLVQQNATGFTTQECITAEDRAQCRFTTLAEQSAGIRAALVGTEAAGCDVQDVRYMGRNDNGRFFEAKCAAGDGYIARIGAEATAQQVYPCATAQQIGGGCTIGTTPAAVTTQE